MIHSLLSPSDCDLAFSRLADEIVESCFVDHLASCWLVDDRLLGASVACRPPGESLIFSLRLTAADGYSVGASFLLDTFPDGDPAFREAGFAQTFREMLQHALLNFRIVGNE